MQSQPRLSTLHMRIISIIIFLLDLALLFYLDKFGKTIAHSIAITLGIVGILAGLIALVLYNKTFRKKKSQ